MDPQGPPDHLAQQEVLDSLVLLGLLAQLDRLEPLVTLDLRGF